MTQTATETPSPAAASPTSPETPIAASISTNQAAAAAPSASNSPQTTPASGSPAAATAESQGAPKNLVSGAAPAAPAIPDKFKVTRADGSIDHEATLLKTLGSYTHLEKRLGSGDVPPENEAGYKLDYSVFPEGVALTPEGEKALLKTFHGSGMTNKQVQTVINKYAEVITQGQEIQKTQEITRVNTTLKSVETELKTEWGADYNSQGKAIVRGFNHLADESDKAVMDNIGKDSKLTYKLLMKVLAKVGVGITEDTQVLNPDGVPGDGTREALMKTEAYTNAEHPEHNATVAKVTALYQNQYNTK